MHDLYFLFYVCCLDYTRGTFIVTNKYKFRARRKRRPGKRWVQKVGKVLEARGITKWKITALNRADS
ncbi:hypothetical protein O3M35_010498 [Rhynocoris fuscipes]|uniref:Uncharacterized protein n=1 Tax=Rhynocoris fuscipes TaxID=488301 RepID=A0AAW1D031_9HEMI